MLEVLAMSIVSIVTTTDLQKRIDAAEPGATLRLGPGRYVGALVITHSIHILGVEGETFIDGDGQGTVVRVDGGEVTFEDVTLSNGRGRYGGALAIDNGATVKLVRCRVEGNRAKHRGGGVYLERGVLHAEGTTFLDNRAPEGGGVFAGGDASVTILGGRATRNRAERGGFAAAADHARVSLRNVELLDNVAGEGPQIHEIAGGLTAPTIEIVARAQ